MILNNPTVWTVEFIDRETIDIIHENKDEARILAKAQRIKEGKTYEIRCIYERVWG